jgi:O-antigen ligase
VLAGTAAAVAAAALPAVSAFEGSRSQRIEEGAAMLALLVLLAVASGLATVWAARRERDGRLRADALPFAARLPGLAVGAVVLTAAGLVVGGMAERGDGSEVNRRVNEGGAARLTSVDSRRYDYWRTGMAAIADEPLRGLGAGAFRVVWLRERPVEEGALEVHSLPLEVALELGLMGVLGLGLFLGGAGAAARIAVRRSRSAAAGPVAACTVFLAHAAIDWDWQLPGVTLPAIVMAGALVALREEWRTAAVAPTPPAVSRRPAQAPPPPAAVEAPPVGSGV